MNDYTKWAELAALVTPLLTATCLSAGCKTIATFEPSQLADRPLIHFQVGTELDVNLGRIKFLDGREEYANKPEDTEVE